MERAVMYGRSVLPVSGKRVSLTLGIKNRTVTVFFVTFRCVYLLLFLCIADSVTFSQAYNITVKERDSRILNCSLPNLGPNVTDNRMLNCSLPGSNISLTLIHNGSKCDMAINGSHEPMKFSRKNAGSYKCCNSTGNCSTVHLIVNYPAEGCINSSLGPIKPGDNFNLFCQVESVTTVFKICWYLNNVPILEGKNLYHLNLNGSCSGDATYTCSPKNSLGTALNGTKVVKIQVPDPPRKPSAKSVSDGIKVSWKAPGNINHCPAVYQIFFGKTDEAWNRTQNISELTYTLTSKKDLLSSGYYRIRLKAFLGFKESNFSSTVSVKFEVDPTVNGGTAGVDPTVNGGTAGEDNAWLIAMGVVLGIVVVAATIGVVLRFRTRRCSLSAHCIGFFSVPDAPNPPSPKKPSIRFKRGPIPVESFASHVKYLHTDGDYRFDQEFEAVRSIHVKGRSWIQSGKPENQPKNRYANVIPYDQSRVVLSHSDDDQESHYINANYVDSYKQINAYIATQGPMANTISDFWRMVWEQNCTVIVMVTNIIEKGRHKCAMYWPSKQAKSEVHGPLRITNLGEESFAHYIVRRFEVKPSDHSTHYSQLKYPRSRTVTIAMNLDVLDNEVEPMIVNQYHFLSWPDHGAPDTGSEYPALDFILRSAVANREGSGPIVVHCSAGVGRSGAYIVIHSMVKRMHETRDLDVFDFLCHIRQQRNLLVQEESQYVFVHDALLHYIESDFKIAVPIQDLKDHLHKLRRYLPNPSTGKTKLEVEFENLNSIQVKHYNLKQAKRACNASKNRSMDFIPADSTRMELFPRPREEGSDYINASYLDGFWKAGAYIATQYPLENTLNDFWRMIWQENCRSIVMLVSQEELQQGYFPTYLPVLYDMARFNKFEVAVDSEVTRGDVVVRELRMASIQDPSEVRKIRHFHFLHWPADGIPWSGQTILQLIDKVDAWEKEVRANAKPFEVIGGIVVHCNHGVDRTGAYCLLHTMYHQIARDKTVSIYQMARLYNHQRPHCLQNQEQYEFCYDTLAEYIDADCSLYLV